MSTAYHAKYFAYQLTRKCSSHEIEKLSASIFNASVDLNPHQLDAALFAFRSPLSRGAILADEVGLGKTIEAGLVISQLWAERKRRILCITPASLRKQWSNELLDKFYINSQLLESREYKKLVKQSDKNPFDQENKIVICSYHFVRSKSDDVFRIPWDLVVIDEAHRLRNVYKKNNKIAKTIRDAIGNRPKVLLTATPLQNSLMELYGLVSFIDPHLFGNEASFREQFARMGTDVSTLDFQNLKRRLQPICQRTLRRQITEYIRYTNRISITQDFTPTDDEVRLYDAVSTYLQRPESFALPKRQRALITLVLRKILASSSFAIAITLDTIINRLIKEQNRLGGKGNTLISENDAYNQITADYEGADEKAEEFAGENDDDVLDDDSALNIDEESASIIEAIQQEADELKSYKELAESITNNAKGEALLIALKSGFEKLAELSAPQKALIFTESKRTQRYLLEHLENNGYTGQVVMFNGTNSEDSSKDVYRRWVARHKGQDCITGTKDVDMRTALVEEFSDHVSIMIATESGAEGLNLQFCNLIVNYDLPWNPQRIEQRIGRCHRYGQKFDVVVINFLNRRNAADQRVFELLSQKLQLFDGVFGASDEVLGVMESGIDFEKRILKIYQSCRTPAEINGAFDQLQTDLDEQIQAKMKDARTKLLEHFDEEVHSRLKTNKENTAVQVGRFEEWLWALSKYELNNCAEFSQDDFSFRLHELPEKIIADKTFLGSYRLVTQRNGIVDHHYRLGHPLAANIIAQAKNRSLPVSNVVFNYGQYKKKISIIEQLQGHSGWLKLTIISIESLETEEHLVFSAINDNGEVLDHEICSKLFALPGIIETEVTLPQEIAPVLDKQAEEHKDKIFAGITDRNQEYFVLEMEKLDDWAEDQKTQLEQELKGLDKEIKATKRESRQTRDLSSKITLQRKVKELEAKRKTKRQKLFDAQDEVDSRKEDLISEIEARLEQKTTVADLFTLRWSVI